MEVSALCQLWEVAFSEGKSEKTTHTHAVWWAVHSLLMITPQRESVCVCVCDLYKKESAVQTEGVKGGGRLRNRLRECEELQQETEARNRQLRAINRAEQREREM